MVLSGLLAAHLNQQDKQEGVGGHKTLDLKSTFFSSCDKNKLLLAKHSQLTF